MRAVGYSCVLGTRGCRRQCKYKSKTVVDIDRIAITGEETMWCVALDHGISLVPENASFSCVCELQNT